MAEFADGPAINDRVALETFDDGRRVVHRATVANLTREEIWVAVGEAAAGLLVVGRSVRVILNRPEGGSRTAETAVRRSVGGSGRLLALRRPETWATHSRRAHGRVRLAIPAYLQPDDAGTVVAARTTNISVGGFNCVADLPVSVGHQMTVALMLTPTSKFECRAQVVRLDEDPEDPMGRQLVLSFRFVDLGEADEALIAEALAALSDETDPTAVPAAWRTGGAHGRLGQ